MTVIILTYLASLLATLFLVRVCFHHDLGWDDDPDKVQRVHEHPVPRLGGVAVWVAVALGALFIWWDRPFILPDYLLLLVASVPAFAAGVAEDLTKRVRGTWRLLASFLAGGLGYYLLGAGVARIDVPLVDSLLQWLPLSLLFTVFAVGGIAHSVNLIDGFNGLASMVSVLILAALGYVAFLLGDAFIWTTAIATAGAVLGFFMWNYPRGLIFLGDGGAYFLGFVIAELSVLLVARHPEVSPWFPVLLLIYPIVETLFSVYRRSVVRGVNPGLPDGVHLHMLIFKRVVRWAVGTSLARHRAAGNAMTAPYLWLLSSLGVIPAVLFWRNTPVLLLASAAFIICYVWLYRSLALFRAPGWLKPPRRKKAKRHPGGPPSIS